MRYLSWLLSFTLHMAMVVVLIQTMRMGTVDLMQVMEVELSQLAELEVVQPLPLTPGPVMVPAPEPEARETTVAQPVEPAPLAPAPLPMDKTVVLDTPPPMEAVEPVIPQSLEPETPEPKVELEPDVIPISPKKVQVAEEKKEEINRKIIVRKHDTIVHRGHEARFGRTLMADYYSYSSTEFSGQFKTRDDRTISIIDARNTEHGRFLIYDSKHGSLRRMKEFGKYVYTIGPSLYEDEPVVGTVTFLAKNDRIERFILTTDDDRIAHFPVKVHVREETVAFPTNDGIREGHVSLPPEGAKHKGVVFLHGNQCVDPGVLHGFTRTLSAQGMAALSFIPDGCAGDSSAPGSVERLVSDARAGLSHFGEVAPVDFRQVGLWGTGPGIPVAIEASSGGAIPPAFMVCMINDDTLAEDLPGEGGLRRLSMPVLWFVTGRDVSQWNSFVSLLESARDDGGARFSIIISPTGNGGGVSAGNGWVDSVTENHARMAISWVENLAD